MRPRRRHRPLDFACYAEAFCAEDSVRPSTAPGMLRVSPVESRNQENRYVTAPQTFQAPGVATDMPEGSIMRMLINEVRGRTVRPRACFTLKLFLAPVFHHVAQTRQAHVERGGATG